MSMFMIMFTILSETNLKCRQPLVETAEMGDDEEELAKFDG